MLSRPLRGQPIEDLKAEFADVAQSMAEDPMLRWLGPHKGVVHLAPSSVINACFDLWAKSRGVPLRKLLLDLEPKAVVWLLDLSYLDEVLNVKEAVALLHEQKSTRGEREGCFALVIQGMTRRQELAYPRQPRAVCLHVVHGARLTEVLEQLDWGYAHRAISCASATCAITSSGCVGSSIHQGRSFASFCTHRARATGSVHWPESGIAHHNRGRVLQEMNRDAEAKVELEEAVRLKSDEAEWWSVLGAVARAKWVRRTKRGVHCAGLSNSSRRMRSGSMSSGKCCARQETWMVQ